MLPAPLLCSARPILGRIKPQLYIQFAPPFLLLSESCATDHVCPWTRFHPAHWAMHKPIHSSTQQYTQAKAKGRSCQIPLLKGRDQGTKSPQGRVCPSELRTMVLCALRSEGTAGASPPEQKADFIPSPLHPTPEPLDIVL